MAVRDLGREPGGPARRRPRRDAGTTDRVARRRPAPRIPGDPSVPTSRGGSSRPSRASRVAPDWRGDATPAVRCGNMNAPQPFQYQGSKRNLALRILDHMPHKMDRLVEPFAGSGAISIACASKGRSREYWLNDLNRPLSELLSLIVNRPDEVADSYQSIWHDRDTGHLRHYYFIRDEFNRTDDPRLLLYLLARCVKGAIRYNGNGNFNQSPDKRRLGTNPAKMRKNIMTVSMLLRGKSIFTSHDFRDVFSSVHADDVVYMDPPYQGICHARDHRYVSGIYFDHFVAGLDYLNRKGVRYLVSYDGRLGSKSYGKQLPDHLDLVLIEIEAGRSTQATLLGQNAITVESLYLSRSLAEEVGVRKTYIPRRHHDQIRLLEEPAIYD